MMRANDERRTPGRRRARQRGRALLAVAALLVFPALISCGKDGDGTSGENAAAEGDAPAAVNRITAFGSVIAAERMEIHLPWAGRVAEVPVWEGQRVTLGDILVVLDASDVDLALEDARLEAESSRGLYEEAASKLDALEVAVLEARQRLERNLQLGNGGSVSAQALATIQAEVDGLVFDRDAASWALKAQDGAVDRAEGAYRRLLEKSAESHVRDNALVCPFERGIVAEVALRAGAEASAGDLAVVLHDEGSLLVEADLPEEFVRDVPAGSPASVVPIADPERSYAGTVVELAGSARMVNGENVVKARIRLDERDGFLREGFNVDVDIEPAARP